MVTSYAMANDTYFILRQKENTEGFEKISWCDVTESALSLTCYNFEVTTGFALELECIHNF